MPNPEILGPATLSITQGIGAFQFFLPKLSEVRKANALTDPDIVGDVRMGEVAAVTLAVGIGVIASSLTGSPVPALVSALMALILISLYETTLWADKPGNPKGGVNRA